MDFEYRNWQKRFYFSDTSYFLTFYTKERFPFFREPIFCDLFVENLRICKSLKGFLLYGWVICYEHVHMLIQPGDDFNISKIMKSLKENVSCSINRILTSESATTSSHFLRVYQDKYDILDFWRKFRLKYSSHHPFPKFKWQKSFHDHYIRNETDFQNHIDYIFYNPQKHGLPNGWPYIFTNPKYRYLTDDH